MAIPHASPGEPVSVPARWVGPAADEDGHPHQDEPPEVIRLVIPAGRGDSAALGRRRDHGPRPGRPRGLHGRRRYPRDGGPATSVYLSGESPLPARHRRRLRAGYHPVDDATPRGNAAGNPRRHGVGEGARTNNPLPRYCDDERQRRPMVISPLWLQGVILTFVFGFAMLGYLALRVYQDHAPVPGRVVSETGQTVFTGEDILARPGGVPDLRPDGVRLDLRPRRLSRPRLHRRLPAPPGPRDAAVLRRRSRRPRSGSRQELQANRYDPATDTLTWTDGQVRAFEALHRHYEEEILNRQRSGAGMGPGAIPDPEEVRRITAFIAWTAWTASARRPGRPYSYTNNWPPEPLVGNQLDRGGRRLEHAVDHRPAGRHRADADRLRPLFPPAGLARAGRTPPALPAAGRRAADAGPAVHRLVLLGGRRPVPGANAAGRGHGPLPRRNGRLLRPGPGRSGCPTT